MTSAIENQNKWEVESAFSEEEITQFSKQLNNLYPALTRVLVNRGIDTLEKAKTYFRPSFKQLHNPFLFKDMDKAVERLNNAISGQENIMIYGDYDVDGTTSVALVYGYLKQFYPSITYYIPDRYKEGYGVSLKGIDVAHNEGISLIIALDCGIKALNQVAYAKEKGIDFIICDHHLPGESLPDAVAILDQKRNDCEYPYKELSGCGVGFKFMEAWTMDNTKSIENLYDQIDLLTISTCADIVPITGENRVFVAKGLEYLKNSPRVGVKSLLFESTRQEIKSVSDVVFGIAPRINAAGRIDSGNKAVAILSEEQEKEGVQMGKQINQYNEERKVLDQTITQEALDWLSANPKYASYKSCVVYNENWHKGVIGIVASRLIESKYRPTIVLTKSGEKVAGSARSVMGYDVYKAIDACSDLLIQFGGHKYAAGLTMKEENVTAFREKFEEVVSATITKEQLIPTIRIDSELELEDITPKFCRVLKQMAPFGPSNSNPVFCTHNLTISGTPSALSGGKHLKFQVKSPCGNYTFPCIAFGLGFMMNEISDKQISIVYSVDENEWRGNITMQLNVRDIRSAS